MRGKSSTELSSVFIIAVALQFVEHRITGEQPVFAGFHGGLS
jgi:hypothetical protein